MVYTCGMDPLLDERLTELETKIDAIWRSVEKARKLFLITMWITIITVLLPLVIAIFVLPSLINSYVSTFDGLL
mgnify:CR=1 FL=1